MPFKKGQSGNPGGRPKDTTGVRELARELSNEALQKLAEWMRSDNPRASVSACSILLDRAWGKPEAKVTLDDKRDITDWSRAELVTFLDDARNGGGRTAAKERRNPEPDKVH